MLKNEKDFKHWCDVDKSLDRQTAPSKRVRSFAFFSSFFFPIHLFTSLFAPQKRRYSFVD